jgi:hypothetical protein
MRVEMMLALFWTGSYMKKRGREGGMVGGREGGREEWGVCGVLSVKDNRLWVPVVGLVFLHNVPLSFISAAKFHTATSKRC